MKRIIRNRNLKYNLMFIGNKLGIITKKRWVAYCDTIFVSLLEKNKSVLKRLKYY